MPPNKLKTPKIITPRIEREMEKRFADGGLPKSWWKTFSNDIRHCLRCGETLQWTYVHIERRKRFVCVECKGIAYQNPKIVGATLPIHNGKIYLLRRAIEPAYGLWSHPAGYMEMGETVEQAALRETWEEIRTRVRVLGPPKIYSYEDSPIVTVIYPTEVIGPTPCPGAESLEVKAFLPNEIPWKELAFRSTFHALRDWVSETQ